MPDHQILGFPSPLDSKFQQQKNSMGKFFHIFNATSIMSLLTQLLWVTSKLYTPQKVTHRIKIKLLLVMIIGALKHTKLFLIF